jgi:hypothetical protein
MWVRYALLVAVRQNLGSDGEAKPSSASFCQSIDVRGKLGGSGGDLVIATTGKSGKSRLLVLTRDAVFLSNNTARAVSYAVKSPTVCPDLTAVLDLLDRAWGEKDCREDVDLLDGTGGGLTWQQRLQSQRQLSMEQPRHRLEQRHRPC